MPQILGNKKYYTVDELAAIIGKHSNTCYAFLKAGKVKSVEVNKGYLISHDALVEYLDSINLPESIIDIRLGNAFPRKKKVVAETA